MHLEKDIKKSRQRYEYTKRMWDSRREIVLTENLLSNLPRKGSILARARILSGLIEDCFTNLKY